MRASAGAKRAARDGARAAHDALPRASDALRDEVLACTAGEIAERVHAGALSAADVTAVYCGAAAAADAELRCNTEEFYEEALKTAAAWTRAPGGAPRLLDGVPISVKDQFSQRGADATCGLAAHVFAPEAEDGLLVELLRDAGAVPFVRTNVPQALLLPESDNAVYGRTDNPWNKDRTPGGSSGGEGALIAARGSVLAYSSVFQRSIWLQTHAHAYHINGKAWLQPKMWAADPLTPRLPFRDEVYKGVGRSPAKLRVGVFEDDGWFEPFPGSRRAVVHARDALRAAGVEVVDFVVPRPHDMIRLYYGIMGSDALQGLRAGLRGEELNGMYKQLAAMSDWPSWLRWCVVRLLEAFGERRSAVLARAGGMKTAGEVYRINAERVEYAHEFFAAMRAARVDALVGPSLPLPALLHGASRQLTPTFSYTFLYNLTMMPAGVVPVTRVLESECVYDSPMYGNDLLTKLARKQVKGAAGLPLAVQVAALPNEDEMCLRVMHILESEIGFSDAPPLDA